MPLDIILKYFPDLSEKQKKQIGALPGLYADWNAKINVVSRKDLDGLMERHVLHSLGIAKVMAFKPGAEIMDIGTGGGFPGIPLAILFPDSRFTLVDSIGKKIMVVTEIAKALELENVTPVNGRAELVDNVFDFIVSRGTASMAQLQTWSRGKVSEYYNHKLKNGILCLKGGDLTEELAELRRKPRVYELSKHFSEEFFSTKKVVYLSLI